MRATKDTILNYLKQLKPELNEKGIVVLALFGSYAKDQQSVYSDIDIAIKKETGYLEKYSSYCYFDLISYIKSKVKKEFHKNIDVFDLDSKSSFKESIEKEIIYV